MTRFQLKDDRALCRLYIPPPRMKTQGLYKTAGYCDIKENAIDIIEQNT